MRKINSIEHFKEARPGEEYYMNLISELSELNKELGAFNNINASVKGGYPLSVKDNICVKGVESTASSKILKGYIPSFSATAVERLLNRDFGFIGKTNMDEFGFGSFGINSERIARNPFDRERVPGGSSAGAAIAASVLKYHIALAESTGGSIAAPASFCGVVGFTPTYGRVSRYGLIDYASSLDKIGVIGRSASDVRYAFEIIKGSDDYDATCIDVNEGKREAARELFVIENLLSPLNEDVKKSFFKTLERLSGMGYRIREIKINDIENAIPVYYIIAMAEASTNLARYMGFKYGSRVEDFSKNYNDFFTEARELFGVEAKRRVVLGTYVRSASVKERYYYKALQIRRLIGMRLSEHLNNGLIILPTMPVLPPRISEVSKLSPLENYMVDILTVPANLAGMPHVSFPTDYINGLPVGTQVIGAPFMEQQILAFVEEWEGVFDYKFKYNLGSL